MIMGWSTFSPAALTKKQLFLVSIFCHPLLVFLSQLTRCKETFKKMARFVHTPNVFQWVAFIQFVYPLHPGSNCFCRQVSGLANVAQWSEVLKSWKLLFWTCSFIATTSSWHGNILIKSHLSCGTCHGVYVTLIFHKPFGVVLKFSFHSLKYLLQLSFRSCKYLLVSYNKVLDFLEQNPKT